VTPARVALLGCGVLAAATAQAEPPSTPFFETTPPDAPSDTNTSSAPASSEFDAGGEPRAAGSDGLLGPFRIGFVVGTGLPNLLSFGGTLKVTPYLGGGVNVGLIPTVKIGYYGEATLFYQEYDAYARVYPFGGAFFVGSGVGYETVRGTLTNTYDLSSYQALVPGLPASFEYRSEASVRTLVVTPQFGLFHTFGSGFSIGIDVGAQIPIAPSQVAFSSQVPTDVPQQAVDEALGPHDQQVKDTLERVGRTPIPTFNLRIGWLF
jgi:hypothetical protein